MARMHNSTSLEGPDWVDWPIYYGRGQSFAYDSPHRVPRKVRAEYERIVQEKEEGD